MILSPKDREILERLLAVTEPGPIRTRAQLLVLYDSGEPTRVVTRLSGASPSRARFWRQQYKTYGLAIFRGAAEALESEETEQDTPTSAEILVELAQSIEPADLADEPADQAPDMLVEQVQDAEAHQPRGKKARLAAFLDAASMHAAPGVQPDDPLAEAGRKVWRYHYAQMLLNEEGTRRGEDIEALHDMRVATRRMRAAFEVFGQAFEPKVMKAHLKGLRATGRALGKVRDLDVFIEKAQHYQADRAINGGTDLSYLLQAWHNKRVAARAEMETFLDGERYRKFCEQFLEFVSTPGEGILHIRASQPVPYLVKDVVPGLIYNRMAAVRAFDSILESARLEQFHALRIEFKKLRYAIEFFIEVLGPKAKLVINEIKTMQDHLGDLNDAQVASQILRDFLVEWDEHQAQYPVQERSEPKPVLDYLAYRYQERQQLMTTFQERWQNFNRAELMKNLAEAISVL